MDLSEFPSTEAEFRARFANNNQCREYLARLKWPEGFRCVHCSGDRAYFTASKQDISAAELQRKLGLGSYQTAWSWLTKIRTAMVRPNREPLCGEVEIDESYVGGPAGKTGSGRRG